MSHKYSRPHIELCMLLLVVLSACNVVSPAPDTSKTVLPSSTKDSFPTNTVSLMPTSTATFAASPTTMSTVTPIPTFTPEPTSVPWQSYVMTNTVQISGASKLWLPVPRERGQAGMPHVEILRIDPSPQELYNDKYGNLIAFWVGGKKSQKYSVTFEINLAPININVDPYRIGKYDRESWDYLQFTQPSKFIQSDKEEVITTAKSIVGDVKNQYLQSKMILDWYLAIFITVARQIILLRS